MRGTVFVTEPAEIEIVGGIARICLRSDGECFHFRMSAHTVISSLETARRAVTKWQIKQQKARAE